MERAKNWNPMDDSQPRKTRIPNSNNAKVYFVNLAASDFVPEQSICTRFYRQKHVVAISLLFKCKNHSTTA